MGLFSFDRYPKFVNVAALVLCSSIFACSSKPAVKIVPVSGIVQLDGKPAAHSMVTFENGSTGFASTGVISEDGRYRLQSVYGNGIPPGEYKVTVGPGETRDKFGDELPPRPGEVSVPKKYHFNRTSLLVATVSEGGKTYDFLLLSK